jgi:23S rRNA U2552 (ribose-2'-O)-methylase RlmE/FtsJ
MNELENFFLNSPHRLMHKWNHYFEIYDRHLCQLRDKKAAENTKVNLLEIGISHGGSLEMWNNYFKGNVNIYAVDINPECKKFETDNVKIFIGSQQDESFLKTLKASIPKLDILIDDGGHTMKQQIVTFEQLYDHIIDNGIYICEDLHTSYWKDYGGGLKKKKSFIEYSKNFIDKLHAWHDKKHITVDNIVEHTYSLHYYDSVLVMEKRKMSPPYDVKAGTPAIEDKHVAELIVQR